MKMKKADVGVAIYIMAAIIMFIVPIPSWLLDILLAINISGCQYFHCVDGSVRYHVQQGSAGYVVLPHHAVVYNNFPNSTEHLLHQTDPAGR